MSKEQSNIIEYLVCVVGAFARQFSLTKAKAYQYLRQYKGPLLRPAWPPNAATTQWHLHQGRKEGLDEIAETRRWRVGN